MGTNSNALVKIGACAAIGVPLAMYLKNRKYLGIYDYLLIGSAFLAISDIAAK